jgi:hypothetical protein
VLLIEADPSGASGILAGFYRGARDYESGLIEIAFSAMPPAEVLRDVVVPIDGTEVGFVAGPRSPIQARGLRDLWEPLAEALSDLDDTGQDVIVDAGRLGLPGSPEPLLASADLTLMTMRTHLPALSGARPWADLAKRDSLWRTPGLLLIGEGQPYTARSVSRVLGLRSVATIADDPAAAAVYHRGATRPRRFDQSGYLRSLRAAVSTIKSVAAQARGGLVSASANSPAVARLVRPVLVAAAPLPWADESSCMHPRSESMSTPWPAFRLAASHVAVMHSPTAPLATTHRSRRTFRVPPSNLSLLGVVRHLARTRARLVPPAKTTSSLGPSPNGIDSTNSVAGAQTPAPDCRPGPTAS